MRTPGLETRRTGPLARAAEEVARQLLPGLRARLRAATQELDDLRRRGRMRGFRHAGDESAFVRLEDLRAASRRWGWSLGVLCKGRGVDLLGTRREREGLRWTLTSVA